MVTSIHTMPIIICQRSVCIPEAPWQKLPTVMTKMIGKPVCILHQGKKEPFPMILMEE